MNTKKIEFKDATIVQLAKYPAEKEPTSVLQIHAPLTLALADNLKCKDMAFTLNDTPRKFDGAIGLPLELGDNESELSIPNYQGVDTLRPYKIWKFKIKHDTDLQLGVTLRIHCKGAADASRLNDLVDNINGDPFLVVIGSTQGELFAEPVVAEQTGKRVDMATGEAEDSAGCVWCDEEIEIDPDDPLKHVNGDACLVAKRNSEIAATGTIASVREVEGGTTADVISKRPRRNTKPAHVDVDDETAAQIANRVQ